MFGRISVTTFLPLFLQVSTGASATRSGLQVVPQSLAITAAATQSGALISRVGRYKWALLIGPVIATAGMISLSTIGASTTVGGLAPFLVLLGLGLGLTFPNTTLAVQNAVPPADLGAGTSTLNFFRNLGSTFGAGFVLALLIRELPLRRTSGLQHADAPAH
jgi:MFS family permease